MLSIFLGRSGAGGGGSSFFLGTTYGPMSFCGPPASGGASCWFGFVGGCCLVSCACEGDAVTSQQSANTSNINCLRNAENTRFCPPFTPQNIGESSKTTMLV